MCCCYLTFSLSFQISPRQPSSSLICCLSTLLIYWPYITLLSHFVFKDSPNLAFVCRMPSLFESLYSFDWFSSSANFAAILIVEFIIGWLLSCLLTMTKWPPAYFVLRYSAISSLLYMSLQFVTGLYPSFFSHIFYLHQFLVTHFI